MTQIDTTGKVATTYGFWTVWSDLSPFTQGYIEALFASLPPKERAMTDGATIAIPHSFRDLTPETLERIIADCEAYQTTHKSALEGMDGPRRPDASRHNDGRMFWHWRNKPGATSYSPLTVQLGDDGKVRFAA